MGIVDKILFLLDKKGLNQKDLTDYLGVKKSVFSSWKSGKSVSFNKYINQIASFLGTTPDYLWGWTDDPTDYEKTEEVTNAPLDVIEHFDGDPKQIYNFQKAAEKDNQEEDAIIILNRKAKQLSSDKLRLLIKMANAMMEEEDTDE